MKITTSGALFILHGDEYRKLKQNCQTLWREIIFTSLVDEIEKQIVDYAYVIEQILHSIDLASEMTRGNPLIQAKMIKMLKEEVAEEEILDYLRQEAIKLLFGEEESYAHEKSEKKEVM